MCRRQNNTGTKGKQFSTADSSITRMIEQLLATHDTYYGTHTLLSIFWKDPPLTTWLLFPTWTPRGNQDDLDLERRERLLDTMASPASPAAAAAPALSLLQMVCGGRSCNSTVRVHGSSSIFLSRPSMHIQSRPTNSRMVVWVWRVQTKLILRKQLSDN